jgi:hypothetical protein
MENATYSVEHAKTARSKCKQCKVEIAKGELRIGKHFPSDFHEEGGTATEWRHPACMFQHLLRAKKAPKITAEAELSGFLLLDEAEQASIRDLIANQHVKSPSKPKKAKAKAAPVALLPLALPPPDEFVCILEPVPGDESSLGLKRVELAAGRHEIGRGDVTGIANKGVSRCQVELTVKPEDRSIVLQRKGTNLSKLWRVGREPIELTGDMFHLLSDGDQISLLGDQYRFDVKTLLKVAPKPAVVVAASPVAAVASPSPKPKAPPKAKAAATTSLEPAKKKAKKTKKKKDDDDEEDPNEPDEYDMNDPFIVADEREDGGADAGANDDDDSDEDSDAPSKKRTADKISSGGDGGHNIGGGGGDDDDDDDDDDDIDELAREARAFVKSGGVTTLQEPCRFGAKCYRTNAQHLADFYHPPREVDTADLAFNASKLLPQMSAEARIDALRQIYAHVDAEVIREVLASNGDLVSNCTTQLADLEDAAIAAK